MWKDIETAEDLLGYRFHAKLLKDIVLDDNMLPTSIGIFGNWGYGKSSLMLLMQKEVDIEIAKQNNAGKDWRVLQVRFNGWQYENYESTKYSLIQVLLDSVESYLSANKDFFEKLDGLLRRINLLKVGVLLLSLIHIYEPIFLNLYIRDTELPCKNTKNVGNKQIMRVKKLILFYNCLLYTSRCV